MTKNGVRDIIKQELNKAHILRFEVEKAGGSFAQLLSHRMMRKTIQKQMRETKWGINR